MEHFRDRYDIIEWLIKVVARPAVNRALENGKIEHLGAFKNLPPGNLCGWVITVESEHNSIWVIAVTQNMGRCRVTGLVRIPWEDYIGGESKLAQGDCPDNYILLCKHENEKRKNTGESNTKEG